MGSRSGSQYRDAWRDPVFIAHGLAIGGESAHTSRPAIRPILSPVPSRKDAGRRPIRKFGRVDLAMVEPNPEQPRTEFSEEAIDRLAQSIREKGQLHPIRVRWSDHAPRLEISPLLVVL